MFQQNWKHQN